MRTWERRTMLEIRDVTAFYGDVQALWGVSLDVRQGEVVAMIGPNGAGKSTLLRTIVGLHRPASGAITLDGGPTHTLAPHRIAERGVILIPEGRRLFSPMTVRENLEVGAFNPRARPERAETMRQVFEFFPILAERHQQL